MPISYMSSNFSQNSTVMDWILLKKCTKFGAKIFRRYQVITF